MVDVMIYFNKFIHIIKIKVDFSIFYQRKSWNYGWGIHLSIIEETLQDVPKNTTVWIVPIL